MTYQRRLLDDQLDSMIGVLPAIAVEGAKATGKTAMASQRARTTFSLDNEATALIVLGNPSIVTRGDPPVFVDEWPLVPSVWNEVRRAVDDSPTPGRFLLAGSAVPLAGRVHSGAGRIVRLVLRPLSLPERGVETPTVSLRDLVLGQAEVVDGHTAVGVEDYVAEIFASGFPGIRSALPEARPYLLRGYLERIVGHDIDEMGAKVARPGALRAWLNAYAAATGTTASYASIAAAATPGEDSAPSKPTSLVYRELLERLYILDPLPAWLPTVNHLARLGQAPKHHLVDPALAAFAVGLTVPEAVRGGGPTSSPRDGTFLGSLFESLATQTVRVLADGAGATVSHCRLRGGQREVDLIVERPDRRVVAMEVKLSAVVRPGDVANLAWLKATAPDVVIDTVLLTTGDRAYRRADGIAVVPLALLGP